MSLTIRDLVRAKARMSNSGRQRRRINRQAVQPLRRNELWYKVQLLEITKLCEQRMREMLYPVLQRSEDEYAWKKESADGQVAVHDAVADDVRSAFDRFANSFGGIEGVAARLAEIAARRNAEAVDAQLRAQAERAIGIDITPALTSQAIKPAFDLSVQANIDLIRSIPIQYLDRVKQSVYNGMASGLRYEALIGEIQHIGDVTESRAKLIARDQTSKMNASFNEARQESLGLKKYTWSTSNDERVRDSHADKEGKVFSWDDPPADTGHPGHDVNCRCVAIAYFDLD